MACAHKTALITGACGGLGKTIAEQFLTEGANVVVCDIRKELISGFKESVSIAYPDRTLVLEVDVTNDSNLDDMFAQAEKTFGRLDYVVNSAGMMDDFNGISEMDKALWDKVLALNLTAPASVIKRAVQHFQQHSIKGSIVNVASIAGVRGGISGAAYTASKHGLVGLTKNTAAFYGPTSGVRCNAVLPGVMKTNIAANLGKDLNKDGITMMQKAYPAEFAPFLETEKVAKLVLHFCSDAGEILNGSCIIADGGALSH